MNNLTIQITPIEVTYQHRDPLPLSCVFKKQVIANNHPLEKYQIKSQPELAPGKNKFNNGPVFALNKEFQLQNTKISLDFIARKERGIACIGSAIIDIATLPDQPQSMLDLNLSNCIYPQGKTKLYVKRKQESTQMKKNSKGKPQVMGILNTQSQLKQQLMLNRRTNPNFPTAYEISRKNYKQAETHCHQSEVSNKKQRSISKGSYQKRFHASNIDSTGSRLRNPQLKPKDESPRPRQRTPEPILLNNGMKRERNKKEEPQNISQKYGIAFRPQKEEQNIEQPLSLNVKPYDSNIQKRVNQTNENISSNISCNDLEAQKKNKYLDITQKLQMIQDRIMGIQQKKYKTEVLSVSSNNRSDQEISQFNYNTKPEKDILHQSYNQLDSQKNQINIGKQSSRSYKESAIQPSNILPQTSSRQVKDVFPVKNQNPQTQVTLSGDKNVSKNTRQTSPAQKSQAVASIDLHKRNQKVPNYFDHKAQIMQLQGLNIQLSKQNELLRVKLFDAEQTVKKLMNQLSEKIKLISDQDKEIVRVNRQNEQLRVNDKENDTLAKNQQISRLTKKVQQLNIRIIDQRNLIQKLTHDYDEKLDQIVILEDELQTVKKSQISTTSGVRTKGEEANTTKLQKEIQQLKQQNLKMRTKLVQAQSNIKLRENEIKHLKLEINNSLAEKKQLQEQIMVMARGKKEEMSRQKSLAHIQQISNTSLAQLTKRQNENLKNQVKILQEKLQNLNKILQSLVNKDENSKKISVNLENLTNTNEKQRQQSKIRQLQQKCGLLEDDLRKKKNQLAQMVNIAFDFGDPQLLSSVQKLMEI